MQMAVIFLESAYSGADCVLSMTGEQWTENDRAEAVAASCVFQCLENTLYAEENLEKPEAVCVY